MISCWFLTLSLSSSILFACLFHFFQHSVSCSNVLLSHCFYHILSNWSFTFSPSHVQNSFIFFPLCAFSFTLVFSPSLLDKYLLLSFLNFCSMFYSIAQGCLGKKGKKIPFSPLLFLPSPSYSASLTLIFFHGFLRLKLTWYWKLIQSIFIGFDFVWV